MHPRFADKPKSWILFLDFFLYIMKKKIRLSMIESWSCSSWMIEYEKELEDEKKMGMKDRIWSFYSNWKAKFKSRLDDWKLTYYCKLNDQFPTTLSDLAYVWRRYVLWNIFLHLENRNEEDSRFLHNLLINIEIIRIFLSQNSLQPILVI
jgi:hypothetical protein